MTTATIEDLKVLERLVAGLSDKEVKELAAIHDLMDEMKAGWLPNPGPQTRALECEADELFYGGQAGGGKTDLLMGAAFTEHTRSLLLRRTNREASRFIQRFEEIVGHRNGWNGQAQVFNLGNGQFVEFGGCQHEDDKQKYKGDPKDLIGFDEISDFSETQYRFIIGWNRSAKKGQRSRVIAAGNPPTKPEGVWVVKYWGAWLDPNHPNPAKPGELRWYTTIAGKDTEVDGPGPHLVNGEYVRARSRTFIPAELDDNPDLSDTDYGSVLAAMPEELRVAYKEGKFSSSLKDHEWQVIPTAHIDAAMERWTPDGHRGLQMTCQALDCAGGGADPAMLVCRYGGWFSELHGMQGEETLDGSAVAGMVIRHRMDGCPVVVDVGGGYAGAAIERFKDNGIPYQRFDGQAKAMGAARGSGLRFVNKRAEIYWRLREELDPDQEGGSVIALPPDTELRAELAAQRWEVKTNGILLMPKEKIKDLIGRSPNKADAVAMCLSEGNKAAARRISRFGGRKPRNIMGYANSKRR